ncbi:phytanoyl-CoA dioxygenase family protein [Methylorubrum populi]|nr:phytanoyl-CoA dioxygenase family protein [Methylorubrum populi]
MTMKPYVFADYDVGRFVADLPRIAEVYHEYGVVIFPRLLESDENYRNYVSELHSLFDDLMARKLDRRAADLEIGEKLTLLASLQPALGKIIAGLGTQHNKFFSFNKVKYSSYIEQFLLAAWGKDALLATPQAGDTLHFFPPGETFHRYNLPPHQDYQYLMQSPRQATMYFGISQYHDGVGGLRIWEKSHELGVLASHKNRNGAFEVHEWDEKLKSYDVCDYSWNRGDFGIFDSLLSHSSIPNTTERHSRIVQIFRYSDLNDDVARSYDFGSTTYPRSGRDFVVEHPDLFVADATGASDA